ncbi:MAG: enoyl-CoA hydratase/isomerase family protein [Burkholderiaceae bacterium]
MDLEFFRVAIDRGIALVTFERPPVNAFSFDVYRELIRLADGLEADENARAVVFAGSAKCKAWIGGADLNDFVGLDYQSRLDRYELVNEANDRFYGLQRPVIAAIGSHAIGAGMTFAAICDLRIAASGALFAMPEIDRGTTSGGGAPFNRLNFPAARMRELLFTGRRFTADELADTGFFNAVVPRDEVLDTSLRLAERIASKSFEALKATKLCCNAVEHMSPQDGRRFTQEYSARLTAGADAKEGIQAFLEKRSPVYSKR